MNRTELWAFTVWLKPGRDKRWWHVFLPKPRLVDPSTSERIITRLKEQFGAKSAELVQKDSGELVVTLVGAPFPEDSLSRMWNRIASVVASEATCFPLGVYDVRPL